MSDASDILRERARMSEECIAAYGLMSPQELRAVAELMAQCIVKEAGYGRCKVCGAEARSAVYSSAIAHWSYCALAALERAITGASDAEGK